ncbi:putative beta-lactamase [Sulfitobacter noctilucicola]|nr:putative beta-lactamase [Sulfitobacter noctilucicola]
MAVADVPARLDQAFRGWVEDVGAQAAVMTVWEGGTHNSDVAIGMSADTAVELASLGKAITALCVTDLIDKGIWAAETTSSGVLGYGPDGITLARLMTHSAGLGPDQTQSDMPRWLDTAEDRSDDAAQQALRRDGQSGLSGSFSYNNENYAILGAMIAAETGQSYAAYCKAAVLDRAGVTTAQISPRTGSMAAWGGWQMSVQDYARFMHWAYGPQGIIGSAPQNWPQAAMGGGAFYGAGMTQRAFRGSMNYWHFGLLCFPERMTAGSYAVRWQEKWSVVVSFDRCLDWDQLFALDAALARAVFQ